MAKSSEKKVSKSEKKVSKKSSKKNKGGSKKELSKQNKTKEKRFFKMIDPKTYETYGRYTGETPKQAASKGFTKLYRSYGGKKPFPKQIQIFVKESTRGSNHKIYGYFASRQKLEEPQSREIFDHETGTKKLVTNYHRNKIKKSPVPEQIAGAFKKTVKKTGSKKSGSKKSDSKKSESKKSDKKSDKKSESKKSNKKNEKSEKKVVSKNTKSGVKKASSKSNSKKSNSKK